MEKCQEWTTAPFFATSSTVLKVAHNPDRRVPAIDPRLVVRDDPSCLNRRCG